MEIRELRLYRETHGTFEAYCQERWRMTRRRANQLVQAAEVGTMVPIENERQARELVPLLREDEQEVIAVWRELRAEYGDDVTAVRVKRVVGNRIRRMRRERAVVAELGPPADVPAGADLRLGDFRSALADVDGRVDAIVTDPPYERAWIERDAASFAVAAARLLKPAGTLVVMFGQLLHYELKPHLDSQLQHRWTGAYVMPGSRARMFVPRVATGWKPILVYTRKDAPQPDFLLDDVFVSDAADKQHHHWGQSTSGTRQLVEAFTKPGELVVDPFLGGGTTAVVCKALGRRFVGCDIDARAVATAAARLTSEAEAA
ncbi:MAG: DNA methyltransferase [Thermoleophilaceae bacterium]